MNRLTTVLVLSFAWFLPLTALAQSAVPAALSTTLAILPGQIERPVDSLRATGATADPLGNIALDPAALPLEWTAAQTAALTGLLQELPADVGLELPGLRLPAIDDPILFFDPAGDVSASDTEDEPSDEPAAACRVQSNPLITITDEGNFDQLPRGTATVTIRCDEPSRVSLRALGNGQIRSDGIWPARLVTPTLQNRAIRVAAAPAECIPGTLDQLVFEVTDSATLEICFVAYTLDDDSAPTYPLEGGRIFPNEAMALQIVATAIGSTSPPGDEPGT